MLNYYTLKSQTRSRKILLLARPRNTAYEYALRIRPRNKVSFYLRLPLPDTSHSVWLKN